MIGTSPAVRPVSGRPVEGPVDDSAGQPAAWIAGRGTDKLSLAARHSSACPRGHRSLQGSFSLLPASCMRDWRSTLWVTSPIPHLLPHHALFPSPFPSDQLRRSSLSPLSSLSGSLCRCSPAFFRPSSPSLARPHARNPWQHPFRACETGCSLALAPGASQ